MKNAQLIYPAADLSEQISTAGKEASGTGNTKFLMNGALTIGTLDGANVEIREQAGTENFFLLGLTAAEVQRVLCSDYWSLRHVEEHSEWRNVDHWSRMSIFNTARSGLFSSDRAIQEYCDDIWHVPPVRVQLD